MVVVAGLTVFEPVAPTAPIPLSIVIVVALVVLHDSVADPPAGIRVGATVSAAVGSGGAVTVSIALAVAELVALVAVTV